VLAVAVTRSSGEHRDDDLGLEPANGAHHVLEHAVGGPELPGVGQALGETEVVGAGEVLARPVQRSGREQLLGAKDSERRPELVPDQVLPSLTAGQREVRRLGPHSAREHREQLGVLVIGVGGDHEDAPGVTEESERLVERDDTPG
jgi:hypothetical protein